MLKKYQQLVQIYDSKPYEKYTRFSHLTHLVDLGYQETGVFVDLDYRAEIGLDGPMRAQKIRHVYNPSSHLVALLHSWAVFE